MQPDNLPASQGAQEPTWWAAPRPGGWPVAPSQNYLCQGNYPATGSKAPGVTWPLHFSDPHAGKGHPVPLSMRQSWESQPASTGTRRGSQVPQGESPKVAWDCLPRFFTQVAGRGQQPNARGVFRPHLNPVTQRPNLAQFQAQGAASCPEAPPSTELLLSHGCGADTSMGAGRWQPSTGPGHLQAHTCPGSQTSGLFKGRERNRGLRRW